MPKHTLPASRKAAITIQVPAELCKISAQLRKETDAFLFNPPDVVDFHSFRDYYNKVAKCVVRAEVDPGFTFNTKTATTLTYVGSILLLALDREMKEQTVGTGLEAKFRELMSGGELALTSEQCSLVLKQQETAMAMKLILKFAAETHSDIIELPAVTQIDPVIPIEKRITKMNYRVEPVETAEKERGDDYAF